MNKCSCCKFWKRDDGEDSKQMGLCRRNPPAFAVNNDWNSIMGVWPPTQEDAWCGEFVPVPSNKSEKAPSGDPRWR